jgi:hypothetical protein
MKKNMTDYLNSNLFNAAGIEPGVRIEAIIVSVRDRDFDDGTTKPIIYTDYLGKGVVLNATRLKALIAAWGVNPDNLIGKKVVISRGVTKYQGNDVPCVEVEPVVANRIGTRGATVTAIGGHREPPKPSAPPLIDNMPGGSDELDDDIPF